MEYLKMNFNKILLKFYILKKFYIKFFSSFKKTYFDFFYFNFSRLPKKPKPFSKRKGFRTNNQKILIFLYFYSSIFIKLLDADKEIKLYRPLNRNKVLLKKKSLNFFKTKYSSVESLLKKKKKLKNKKKKIKKKKKKWLAN